MRTAHLNDHQIVPSEYRNWREARSHLTRPRSEDLRWVNMLIGEIPGEGAEPLLIGVSDKDHSMYVSDGHHRAVALMILEEPWFSFRWCWLRWGSTPVQSVPFPEHLLEDSR
jgi:hypothetical protein